MWIRAFAVLFELRERVIQSINNPKKFMSALSPKNEANANKKKATPAQVNKNLVKHTKLINKDEDDEPCIQF